MVLLREIGGSAAMRKKVPRACVWRKHGGLEGRDTEALGIGNREAYGIAASAWPRALACLAVRAGI